MITDKKYNIIQTFWSGGLDSTYMIQKLLDENKNNVVRASYIEIMNNVNKVKMETDAIKKMTPIFKEKYKERFEYLGTTFKAEVINVGIRVSFYQMPIWISAIVLTIGEDVNQVAVGYVMNDDAISYLSEFKQVIRGYNKICRVPMPKVIFPLSKCPKGDFVTILDRNLLKHVVCCEIPIIDGEKFYPCGECHPCKRNPVKPYMITDKVETFVVNEDDGMCDTKMATQKEVA